jgi:uncharacterized protein (TIGR02996 family)
MDHGPAFLEAIREHPDDDLHRLAWADWLDDHGQDARAAFLRAQVEAARLGPDDPRRDALEDEADDLLAEHEAEWAGRVGQLALEWRWRRGCIEHVTAWADTLLGRGEELFAAMPIRAVRLLADADELPRLADWPLLGLVESLELAHTKEASLFAAPYLRDGPILSLLSSRHLGRLAALDLRGQGVEGPALEAILEGGLVGQLRRLELADCKAVGDRLARRVAATPSRLERLSLAGTNLTPHGLRALLASDRHPELRELDVNFGMLFRGEVGARPLEADLLAAPLARQLTALRFERVAIDPAAMEALLAAAPAGRLTSLDLEGCWHGEEVAEALAASPGAANLRRLAVPGNVLRDKGVAALAASPHLARLTDLDVSQNRVGGPGLRALLGSANLARLERLNLAMNFVGAAGSEALARGQPRRLTSLDLGSTILDVGAAEVLLASPALSRLRELWLNGNRLGDEGVAVVARSPHLPRLCQLHLDNNEIDSPGAQALLDSPHLRRVQQLSMRNAFITSNEREQLRARFGPATQF